MADNSKWPNAARIVWSSGGIVALNNHGPEVLIGAGIDGPVIAEITITSYASLFARVRGEGYLTQPERAQAMALPMRSREQVDFIIKCADRDGACDDALRHLIYQVFKVEAQSA